MSEIKHTFLKIIIITLCFLGIIFYFDVKFEETKKINNKTHKIMRNNYLNLFKTLDNFHNELMEIQNNQKGE
jgi:heme/copper-type cytochrome/quinol oxidase subunit 2